MPERRPTASAWTTCRTASTPSAPAPREPACGSATPCSTSPRAARARPSDAQRLHGPRPGRLGRDPRRDRRARRGRRPAATPLAEVRLHLPFAVGDYVDFYASLDHASNVGRIFRPDQEPLLPNWRHLPVGYHGRGGTVVVSGTPVVRPCGQRHRPPARSERAEYGPSRRLDIEAELGFVVGAGSALSSRIAVDEFADHVFGVVGLNDWSARDIQAWEYVPLGPFLGKSFATSVSAWVTPLAALDAAWCDLPGPGPDAVGVPGLDGSTGGGGRGLDIDVEVVLNGDVVSRPPYRTMYWSPAQMLAHLTVNGASTRTGRPVRLRHHQRARPRTPAARSWSCRGAARSPSATAARSSRTATRSSSATPRPAPAAAGSRWARSPGRIEPARP